MITVFQQPEHRTATVEAPPGPGASTWIQDVSVGGEDAESHPAPRAQAVSVQGIALVRNVPALEAAANAYATPAATAVHLVGATPQRRAITIIATVAGTLATSKDNAIAGAGLPIPANVPVPLQSAGEIWFYSASAATVGFWAELDRG